MCKRITTDFLRSTLSSDELLFENGHKLTQVGDDTIEMKYCLHCGEWHPLTDFYKSTNTKDGLQSWCKECINNRRKEIRYTLPTDFESETKPLDEKYEQEATPSLDTILDMIREREQERVKEIVKLHQENRELRSAPLDVNRLSERDIENYLKTHNISLRILFEAIARREDDRYSFYAYEKDSGLTIPIRVERIVA